jgi:hypothetical protein
MHGSLLRGCRLNRESSIYVTWVAGPDSAWCQLSVWASNTTPSGWYLREKLVRLARVAGAIEWVSPYCAMSRVM